LWILLFGLCLGWKQGMKINGERGPEKKMKIKLMFLFMIFMVFFFVFIGLRDARSAIPPLKILTNAVLAESIVVGGHETAHIVVLEAKNISYDWTGWLEFSYQAPPDVAVQLAGLTFNVLLNEVVILYHEQTGKEYSTFIKILLALNSFKIMSYPIGAIMGGASYADLALSNLAFGTAAFASGGFYIYGCYRLLWLFDKFIMNGQGTKIMKARWNEHHVMEEKYRRL